MLYVSMIWWKPKDKPMLSGLYDVGFYSSYRGITSKEKMKNILK